MTLHIGVPAEPPSEPDGVSFVTVHMNGQERLGIRTGTHIWLVPPDHSKPRLPWFVIPLVAFCLASLFTGLYLAAVSPANDPPAPAATAEAPLHPSPIAPTGPGKDWRRGDH